MLNNSWIDLTRKTFQKTDERLSKSRRSSWV
jgi:hypothetical protein